MDLWRSVENIANHGGEDARLWRRREGKNEKKGVEMGREQVEQEGRDGTNGKMG